MTNKKRTARLHQDTRRANDRTFDDSLTPRQFIVTTAAGFALFFIMPWALWFIS